MRLVQGWTDQVFMAASMTTKSVASRVSDISRGSPIDPGLPTIIPSWLEHQRSTEICGGHRAYNHAA